MTQAQILIVEDELLVANDLAGSLKDLEYAVAGIATSGEDALELASAHKIDLVLMDIRLAGKLDGIETAEQMLTRFNLPVIYLTAHNDKQTLERAKITTPYGYILKPFEERELHASVEMALYRHQTEQLLASQAAELEKIRRLEALGVLAGGLAHELNNILTIISGNLFLVQLLSQNEPEIKQSTEEAEEAIRRAKDLAAQLLTFARGGELVKMPIELDKLIREAAEPALLSSTAKLQITIPKNLWKLEADWEQLHQVIYYLVRNALEAMSYDGKLEVKAENFSMAEGSKGGMYLSPGNYVKLMVVDQGEGIHPEHLPKIFEPYFSTKPGRNGLELAIAYSIIKRHEGYIEVASTPGKGTTFTFYLPVLCPSYIKPAIEPAKSHPHPAHTSATGLYKPRLLVMDDELSIRKLMARLLRRLNYDVVLTCEGTETIACYQEAVSNGQPFDVVILDLTVHKGMGGRETMAQLYQFDNQVKAIVSSGYSDDPLLENYYHYGFKARLNKPYQLEDLLKILRELI
jgi:signal transduction histidine kinase